jgi:hypothetical protein
MKEMKNKEKEYQDIVDYYTKVNDWAIKRMNKK